MVPETEYLEPWITVPISAAPDSGWWFTSWTGEGQGSYTGPDSSAVVTMWGAITETAHFSKNEDVTIETSPTGLAVTVDGAPYVAPAYFVWPRGEWHSVSTDSVQAGEAGTRYRYDHWSDGGARMHDVQVPNGPLACRTGPTLLGTLFVNDPGGGELCLVPAADTGELRGVACSELVYQWPEDLKVTGGRTGIASDPLLYFNRAYRRLEG